MVEHSREGFSKEVVLELTFDMRREQAMGRAWETGIPARRKASNAKVHCEGSSSLGINACPEVSLQIQTWGPEGFFNLQ